MIAGTEFYYRSDRCVVLRGRLQKLPGGWLNLRTSS